MVKVVKSNASKHKLFLVFLKIVPFLLGLEYFLATLLQLFDIDVYLLSYLFYVGIIPWLFLLVTSFVFKFCEYHRIFLYYILLNEILNIINYNTDLFGSDDTFIRIHFVIFFLTIIITLILYFYAKQNSNITQSVAEND